MQEDKIVGIKCPMKGEGCQPLMQSEADEIIRICDEKRERRAKEMPTEREALRIMQDAYTRLTELGWRDAIYCPKDGSTFKAIEPGSTGIHNCHYEGKWPDGKWYVCDAGDIWPSRPCLFKKI